jgi:tRNA modification GTPase
VTPGQARTAFDQLEGTLTRAIGALHQSLFDVMAQLEASLDFPEEGYRFADPAGTCAALGDLLADIDRLLGGSSFGRLIREGRQVVIVGRPNVGKSSIFNALLGSERAIVTDVAGTTRDVLAEGVDVLGVPIRFVDTAGLRDSGDVVEHEGVRRARQALRVADLALVVLDLSESLTYDDRALIEETRSVPRVIAANKADRLPAWDVSAVPGARGDRPIAVSAIEGTGLDAVRESIVAALARSAVPRDQVTVTNVRHVRLLERARAAIARASAGIVSGASEEFVLIDLLDGRQALEEITGARTPDDILTHIFSSFCIGK